MPLTGNEVVICRECAAELVPIRVRTFGSVTCPGDRRCGICGGAKSETGLLGEVHEDDVSKVWMGRQRYLDKLEIDRLTKCLAKANASSEDFERRWYLATDRIAQIERCCFATDVLNSVRDHVKACPLGWDNGKLLSHRSTSDEDVIRWIEKLNELVGA